MSERRPTSPDASEFVHVEGGRVVVETGNLDQESHVVEDAKIDRALLEKLTYKKLRRLLDTHGADTVAEASNRRFRIVYEKYVRRDHVVGEDIRTIGDHLIYNDLIVEARENRERQGSDTGSSKNEQNEESFEFANQQIESVAERSLKLLNSADLLLKERERVEGDIEQEHSLFREAHTLLRTVNDQYHPIERSIRHPLKRSGWGPNVTEARKYTCRVGLLNCQYIQSVRKRIEDGNFLSILDDQNGDQESDDTLRQLPSYLRDFSGFKFEDAGNVAEYEETRKAKRERSVAQAAADFSGLDLRGVSFAGADFGDFNYNHHRFSSGDHAADISHADFSGTKLLTPYDFSKVKAHGADFSRARFRDTCFDEALLQDAIFDNADFTASSPGELWSHNKFRNADLTGASFRGAQLGWSARILSDRIPRPGFEGSVSRVSLEGANCERVDWEGAELSAVDFTDAKNLDPGTLEKLFPFVETAPEAFAHPSGDGSDVTLRLGLYGRNGKIKSFYKGETFDKVLPEYFNLNYTRFVKGWKLEQREKEKGR